MFDPALSNSATGPCSDMRYVAFERTSKFITKLFQSLFRSGQRSGTRGHERSNLTLFNIFFSLQIGTYLGNQKSYNAVEKRMR